MGHNLTIAESAASQATSTEADNLFLSLFSLHLLEERSQSDVGLQLLHSQEMIPYEA